VGQVGASPAWLFVRSAEFSAMKVMILSALSPGFMPKKVPAPQCHVQVCTIHCPKGPRDGSPHLRLSAVRGVCSVITVQLMTDDRFAWIRADVELATRLAAVWPAWEDTGGGGLAATLDQLPDWSGWDAWPDSDKQHALTRLLDAWQGTGSATESVAGPGTEDRLAWVRDDAELVDRLAGCWPSWNSQDADGLAAVLDGQPDWAGWDAWEPGARRDYLMRALDAWYPPAEPETQAADEPLAWVHADPALVTRLDEVWTGWARPDESGLLAVLDRTPEWSGWPEWDADQQRGYLKQTLDVWYPAEETPPAAEPPADEKATDGPQATLAAAVAEARATVPGAADLSDEEIRRLLTEVLNEEIATHAQ
jgi:hypothetical protein